MKISITRRKSMLFSFHPNCYWQELKLKFAVSRFCRSSSPSLLDVFAVVSRGRTFRRSCRRSDRRSRFCPEALPFAKFIWNGIMPFLHQAL